MVSSIRLFRLCAWLNVPLGVMLALLQRTPVLRVLAGGAEAAGRAPAVQLLRSAFAAAGLGALHSRAGATTYLQTPANPIRGAVGTPIAGAFAYTGAPSEAQFWRVLAGQLPPGVTFIPAANAGVIQAKDVGLGGTPTQGGNYSVTVQAIGVAGQSTPVQINFEISGGAVAIAPSFTTQPQSQTVTAGSAVVFTVAVSGTPAPTFQWRKEGGVIAGATDATLTLPAAQMSDAGTYTVVATNSAGSVTSAAATLTVTPAAGPAPVIVAQPNSQAVGFGGSVAFRVRATGAATYQWRHNGQPLPGATSPTLVLSGVTAADAGAYSVSVSGGGSTVVSLPATLVVNSTPDLGRLINLSILTSLSATDPSFTLGTVVGGAGTSGSKPLLVRGVGPALEELGVTEPLPDPKLEVFSGQTLSAQNDDWGGTAALSEAFTRVGAFAYANVSSRDAATFDPALPAGAYTVKVSDAGGASGLVLAELYDASPSNTVTATTPRLVNVSVLKQIDAGAALTVGFVVGGGNGAAKTVLLRAIGPALGTLFGVQGAMVDPKLELFNDAGSVIAENDDWGGDPQLAGVAGRVGAFPLPTSTSTDAVLVATLPPGNYTMRVTGVSGGGLALVEAYEVP